MIVGLKVELHSRCLPYEIHHHPPPSLDLLQLSLRIVDPDAAPAPDGDDSEKMER